MDDLNLEHLSDKEVRYDEMLLSILQNEGKIEPFLDHIFKFLYRRTDFFLIQETPDLPYGFPANIAKQIVLKTFQKYDNIPKEKLKQKLLETNKDISNKVQSKIEKTAAAESSSNANNDKSNKDSAIKTVENKLPSKTDNTNLQNNDLKQKQDQFQQNPSSYNGAIRDTYSWTQSIKDLDIRVKIGSHIKSGKDAKVKIDKEMLQISIKEDPNTWKFLINDKLPWRVKPDECTWSLFPGDHIHVYLEKHQERWWENLLCGEEKIDLKNINPEKPMEDLDQESQEKIKQMMYDERQKKLGLPTSEEQRNIDILKKAWDADGSPFKGTPFDPSVLLKKDQI